MGRRKNTKRRVKRTSRARPSMPRVTGAPVANAYDDGLDDILALRRERGEPIERKERLPGEPVRVYERKAGLEWLFNKGKITKLQKAIGERYGGYYRFDSCDTMLGSQLGAGGGGSDPTIKMLIERAESRTHATGRLNEARAHLCHQTSMISALDVVCGQEKRPAEEWPNEREALKMEAVLVVALDLLGELWRMTARTDG